MSNRKNICIGIPCFQGVPAETLDDYMRFAYYLGRRYLDYDFFLAIKSKSEQFRARNSIIEAALKVGADYLMMLDDDHVIDWEGSLYPSHRYGFLNKLLNHLTEGVGIVGALYYHRGGACLPVVMCEDQGKYRYLRDDEITGKLQEVAVTGGGCMLINMKIFEKISSPWFVPETEGFGTDVQICRAAKEAGYKIFCDTSVALGHVLSKRDVVTPENRFRFIDETYQRVENNASPAKNFLWEFRQDVENYLGLPMEAMQEMWESYRKNMAENFSKFSDTREYYQTLSKDQIARQLYFHHLPTTHEVDKFFINSIDHTRPSRGLDYGCGASPVGFEFAKRGHFMDFVDIDGSPAYEFLKWRIKRHGLTCGFKVKGPYDFVTFFDSIEHLPNWEEVLGEICDLLVENGAILTNYFQNRDYDNMEHISMDQPAVKKFLIDRGLYPINDLIWMKIKLKEEAA